MFKIAMLYLPREDGANQEEKCGQYVNLSGPEVLILVFSQGFNFNLVAIMLLGPFLVKELLFVGHFCGACGCEDPSETQLLIWSVVNVLVMLICYYILQLRQMEAFLQTVRATEREQRSTNLFESSTDGLLVAELP